MPYDTVKMICQAQPFTEEVQKILGTRFSCSKQVDSVCLQWRWGGDFLGITWFLESETTTWSNPTVFSQLKPVKLFHQKVTSCGIQMTVSEINFWERNNLCCHYFVVQSTSVNFSFSSFREWSFPALFKIWVSFIHPYWLLFMTIRNSSPVYLLFQRESAGVPEETFELKGRSLQYHRPSPVLLSSQQGLQQIIWKWQTCFLYKHSYKTCKT